MILKADRGTNGGTYGWMNVWLAGWVNGQMGGRIMEESPSLGSQGP